MSGNGENGYVLRSLKPLLYVVVLDCQNFLQLSTLTRQIPSLYQFLADAVGLNLSGIG